MNCLFCPVIIEELLYRLQHFNDLEGKIPGIDVLWREISNCYCYKTGEVLQDTACNANAYGTCITEKEWRTFCSMYMSSTDAAEDLENNDNREDFMEFKPVVTKKQQKRQRDRDYKRKLRRISYAYNSRRLAPAIPVDINGKYAEEDDIDFVRYKRSYNYRGAKNLRRFSNRKVRKTMCVYSRGGYRKCFDYWWELV